MRFSVVIPTYERPRSLSACLDALARLDYPGKAWEVIVVDDGSSEPPQPLIESFADRMTVQLISQTNAGPAAARNRGAAAARGEFLAFTDDDCAPGDQWLRAFERRLRDDPGAGLGGRIVNALPDQLCASASQLLLDYLYDYFNSGQRVPLYATSNMAVRAEYFHALGGFDETFPRAGGEDRDFSDRWARDGRQWVFVPDAVVTHAHPMGPVAFARQHFNYGIGAHCYHRRRAERDDTRPSVEPSRFYWNLVAYPFSSRASRPFATAALLGLSQAANALGFGWSLISRRA